MAYHWFIVRVFSVWAWWRAATNLLQAGDVSGEEPPEAVICEAMIAEACQPGRHGVPPPLGTLRRDLRKVVNEDKGKAQLHKVVEEHISHARNDGYCEGVQRLDALGRLDARAYRADHELVPGQLPPPVASLDRAELGTHRVRLGSGPEEFLPIAYFDSKPVPHHDARLIPHFEGPHGSVRFGYAVWHLSVRGMTVFTLEQAMCEWRPWRQHPLALFLQRLGGG